MIGIIASAHSSIAFFIRKLSVQKTIVRFGWIAIKNLQSSSGCHQVQVIHQQHKNTNHFREVKFIRLGFLHNDAIRQMFTDGRTQETHPRDERHEKCTVKFPFVFKFGQQTLGCRDI
tara:strand:- start:221 stop:571 length:351 start_codon:yes stop_codon:yes gene_type:complete